MVLEMMKHRNQEQNRNQGHANHRCHIPHGDEAVGNLLVGADVYNSRYFLDLRQGLVPAFPGLPA